MQSRDERRHGYSIRGGPATGALSVPAGEPEKGTSPGYLSLGCFFLFFTCSSRCCVLLTLCFSQRAGKLRFLITRRGRMHCTLNLRYAASLCRAADQTPRCSLQNRRDEILGNAPRREFIDETQVSLVLSGERRVVVCDTIGLQIDHQIESASRGIERFTQIK